ncbi:MAG: DegT/DnrJ/EryC1/StrS family aminotransferase [Candidatus Omnitrophota bacterium]|nr:DegT/DnrJ/EryC1/StrS family aminotransferase [Candidatus Omnitrophota bacterium]
MTVSEKPSGLNWPLMSNNISKDDINAVIRFLKGNPRLTQSEEVQQFESEWAEWVGVRYSVFVNSGSSANLLTLAALREIFGPGEIIVPPLTWVSDIAAVFQCGFQPVFADIHPRRLGLDDEEVFKKITPNTKAVFLTHILGYNALTDRLIDGLKERGIPLIEDACESHGATFKGKRVGSHGWASNFSFYYAHHLSTIEGGMVCTNDEKVYQTVRMLRSHGLVRESTSEEIKSFYATRHKDLNPEFIFAFPAYNVRSTEINAVIGRHHLPRLEKEIEQRNYNLNIFLSSLDPKKYRADFEVEGASNYAFTLVLQESFKDRVNQVTTLLGDCGVEYRRGLSGGGNQLRQPYLRHLVGDQFDKYPQVELIHFLGFYIGNYPDLEVSKIKKLCSLLNDIN